MKILIRGANWIGDAVMTIPAIREVRRLFPEAEIALHTRSRTEGIFRDADFIDRMITFEGRDRSFTNTYLEARRLRSENFDLAILFPNSFGSAAVVRMAGVPLRFGYSSEGRGVLLSHPLKRPAWRDERHQTFYYLNLITEIEKRVFGTATAYNVEPHVSLPVSGERKEAARTWLYTLGVDLNDPIVAIGAGSTNSMAKRWGEQRFAELANLLRAELAANILLLGAENEADVSRHVAALAEADVFDLTGMTSVDQVTAILSIADIFLSNDMGLAHVSAAVGTPTVVIFGPTNEVVTRPLGINVSIVREPVECSPCMLRDCPIDHRCMTRITPKRVFEVAKQTISK